MQFSIEVINVKSETKPTAKGSYIQLDVAYKRLDTGKIEGKKIMSFTNKEVFDAVSKATNGQQLLITSEKNEKSGYWDWTAVGGSTGGNTVSEPAKPSAGYASPKSTYETPEERAKRQVLIVRQSSITAAISTLKTEKTALNVDAVLALATEYVDFVFQGSAKRPSMEITDLEDDIPF